MLGSTTAAIPGMSGEMSLRQVEVVLPHESMGESPHEDSESAPLTPLKTCKQAMCPVPALSSSTPKLTWYDLPGPAPSLSAEGGEGGSQSIPLAAVGGTWWSRRLDFARRLLQYSGPGVLVAVGYMDPGNWSTGLKAGAGWGYAHLFIVLVSSLIGMFLQSLTVRLSVVGKRDLSQACRDTFPVWVNGVLWVSAELAMIATDLAEVIGFSVAFQLLTGAPTWAGVILSTGDTLLLFLLPVGGSRARALEIISLVLILVIAASFLSLLVFAHPPGVQVLEGYLPSSPLFHGEAIVVAVGILGATVMPHNLYLHGALVRLRVLGEGEKEEGAGGEKEAAGGTDTEAPTPRGGDSSSSESEALTAKPNSSSSSSGSGDSKSTAAKPASAAAGAGGGDETPLPPTSTSTTPSSSSSSLMSKEDITRQSLELGQWDTVLSLVGAFAVNSSIVVVASASFSGEVASGVVSLDDASSLSGAYRLLQPALGRASSYLFAAALLASGQSSTFTGTMAGQVVMEGFLHLRLPPFARRLVTRCVAILPAAIAVVLAGDAGLNRLLVLSQVTLSFQLPFAIIPLVYFTTSNWAMGPFTVSRFTGVMGWAICAFVLALNAYMLYTALTEEGGWSG